MRIIRLLLLVAVTASSSFFCLTAGIFFSRQMPGEESPRAAILAVRVQPTTTPTGRETKAVLVDWKNVGTKKIRTVWANITAIDGSGRVIDGAAGHLCIYAAGADEPGISPGETRVTPWPSRKILILADGIRATEVVVDLTRIEETGYKID